LPNICSSFSNSVSGSLADGIDNHNSSFEILYAEMLIAKFGGRQIDEHKIDDGKATRAGGSGRWAAWSVRVLQDKPLIVSVLRGFRG
jgi:hypothetical protein